MEKNFITSRLGELISLKQSIKSSTLLFDSTTILSRSGFILAKNIHVYVLVFVTVF